MASTRSGSVSLAEVKGKGTASNITPVLQPASKPKPATVVSLASLRSKDPEPWKRKQEAEAAQPRRNANFQPRTAHPGGKLRSNKNEALLLFLKRRESKGLPLTPEQTAALARAAGDDAALAGSAATLNAPVLVSASARNKMLEALEKKVEAGEEEYPLLRQEKGADLRVLLPTRAEKSAKPFGKRGSANKKHRGRAGKGRQYSAHNKRKGAHGAYVHEDGSGFKKRKFERPGKGKGQDKSTSRRKGKGSQPSAASERVDSALVSGR